MVCLGVGGMVDLGLLLGLESEGDDTPFSGVEVWVIDAHRPWNLGNVFGGFPLEAATDGTSSYQSRSPVGVDGGRIGRAYKPGRGGIVAIDDGDIEEDLAAERSAYLALVDMPELDDNDGADDGLSDDDESDADEEPRQLQDTSRSGQKRKSWSDGHDDESSDEEDRPRQRRRSNSVSTSSLLHLDCRCSDKGAVKSHSRVPATASAAWTCVIARSWQHPLERPCRTSFSSAATSCAFCSYITTPASASQTKKRGCLTRILQNGCIFRRAHLIDDVFTSFRTRPRRQRSSLVGNCWCHVNGALWPVICRNCCPSPIERQKPTSRLVRCSRCAVATATP